MINVISLNSLLYPHELEELRLESIKVLKTLLFFLEKNSTLNSSDLSKEIRWDNLKIIKFNWYNEFLTELFQYFSLYGKEKLNLTCNMKFYGYLIRFIPIEMIPELRKGLELLTSILSPI